MPIELRSWINPQSYSNSYSTAPIAREAVHTSRLRVVVAHRPRTQAPTASARAVATLDRVSAGRTGVHLILGSAGGSDLPRDGDLLDRAGRYRRAAENLQIFTGVLTRDEPFDFDGEFYQVRGAFSGVKPAQSPRPAISLPAESPEAVELAARHADVLAFHGASRAKAAAKIAEAKAAAAAAGRSRVPGFWVNLNLLVGETDEAARRHLRDLEQSVRRLQEFRSGEPRPGVRSIREDRFSDVDPAALWEDDVLYLGLTRLSRATPTLVGAPCTIADVVLAYHDLGIGVVTLGSHVTSARDAELRAETLRLIKQAVAGRDAAAPADRSTTAAA